MSTAPVVTHQPTWRIITADAVAGLATLPDASVHTVVTSPPYWNLRDYQTGRWEGGGEACDHKAPSTGGPNPQRYTPGGGEMFRQANDKLYRDTCGKCGARRVDDQIGLEASIDAYLARLVAVFEQVRRVLHPSGVLWVNQGDGYSSGYPGSRDPERWPAQSRNDHQPKHAPDYDGLPAKNLIGMPWRLAFALQAAGWILRAECIWAKPNPMPESVTDRPTRAHEQVFLFSKQARYYYDAVGVAEPSIHAGKRVALGSKSLSKGQAAGANVKAGGNALVDAVTVTDTKNLRTVWEIPSEPFSVRGLGNGYTPEWTGQDHYAAFPTRLAERCILAGSSQRGVCPACLAPWRRLVERSGGTIGKSWHPHTNDREAGQHQSRPALDQAVDENGQHYRVTTLGWAATCTCGLPEDQCVPATVLDPFVGTGTTILTALRHGRAAVGIDLSPAYVALARARIIGDAAFNALTEVGE